MLTETLFVQEGLALDLAVIVRALSILVKLEGSLSSLGLIGTHESCCVLLKLGSLGFNLKLIVAVEVCFILLVEA